MFSQFLLQNMSRSNTVQGIGHAKTQTTQCTDRAVFSALNFDSLFFGSSYKIVFNIFKFVIYPPAAEAQYLTLDSIAGSIDA